MLLIIAQDISFNAYWTSGLQGTVFVASSVFLKGGPADVCVLIWGYSFKKWRHSAPPLSEAGQDAYTGMNAAY